MIQLGVNIDHVATVRQARRGVEPDPVRAAHEAEIGGADGITVHLREDRRHIQDSDVERLRASVNIKLNLEMAATDEMAKVARRVKPQISMLVPEGRQEITTEGGLDVRGQIKRLRDVVKQLKDGGMIVSAFIDPDIAQVEAAHEAGFDVCEVHTGPYAHAYARAGGDFLLRDLADEHRKVVEAGRRIREMGMRFNAGHALNYHNVNAIAGLEGIAELHIGHAIVSRAVYVGLREAVREMKRLMVEAAGA
ncbi:MAG: pyridoxine 5'-phosphate synthase [Phycisphaeraceae bacterium]|nr:pyridoxine 5'-phosphate synthase [Phycisphaerales bacterium]MCB9844313.1 pyridoxine 5'-phosphate synthase [Phycisphaeraceae bacterium]